MSKETAHILLVESEPTLQQITAFRLELLGYRVTCQESSQEATRWLEEQLPDLLAVGQLEDIDPLEFLNVLSNDERTSQLPMIYVSTSSDLEEVQRAFNAGADEFLVSPFDPAVLEKKVEVLLDLAHGCKP